MSGIGGNVGILSSLREGDDDDEEGEEGAASSGKKKFFFGNILPATIFVHSMLLNGNIG
jgi:hypothetical protein